MNLENYLSATLPSSIVAKMFDGEPTPSSNGSNNNNKEEEDDLISSASPAKRQKLDLEDKNEKQEEEDVIESSDNPDRDNTTAEAVTEASDDFEFENEASLIDILMNSFDAATPRELLSHMIPSYVQIPDDLDNFDICRLIFQMVAGEENLPKREKLAHVNSIDDVVGLIKESKNILVLTGAGCSVSCGIPDFRSRNGIYARLHKDYPDLPDPQSMFDIAYFQHNPRPFFKFAKEIYPGQFKPSLSHLFIKKIEEKERLLRNYTQNIDTIELIAGIKNIIQCHGSFATATCTNQSCKYKVKADDIREAIFNQEIPKCHMCNEEGILKPDIVFFGESLPETYHKAILEDKEKCDLLIVIGSSLKVKPVAHIPSMLKEDVPQILINRESLKHMNFDVELLGDCDAIVKELLLRLGDEWTKVNEETTLSQEEKLKLIEDEKEIHDIISECEKEQNDPTAATATATATAATSVENVFISSQLKENTFLNLKPNVYVFQGAEITASAARRQLLGTEEDDDLNSATNDEDSSSSNEEEEEEETKSSEKSSSSDSSNYDSINENSAKTTSNQAESDENKQEL